jgi:predicted DNA binding protein/FixJ family two-component response regulator
MSGDTLDVLLIEDNTGDARLVEEMLVDAGKRLHRIDLDGTTPDRITLHHESDLAAGLERASESAVDVVLLDLGLPDSAGLPTLDRVVEATEFTPIVVLTGLDDRQLGVQAIQRGAHDYLVKDDVTEAVLIHSIQYAIEQARQTRERVRHREQLETLNRLNRIGQDVTHAVITESTREDLERAVCERLVESDAYRFAWLGEVDRSGGRFAARTAASVDGGFDVATVPFGGVEGDERPEARAVRTREPQAVQDVPTDPAFDLRREQIAECGYRSMAAIPISYRTVFYGILAIYDGSPNTFTDTALENLSRLGEVIGHAITAVERKEALVSDATLQLEFRLENVCDELVERSTEGWTLAFERLIRSDEGFLLYGRAEGIPGDELSEVVGRSELVDDLRKLSSGTETYECELVTSWGDELVRTLAEHGGLVTSVTVTNGEFKFVVEVPTGRDKHQVVELVEEHYPDATLHAQRTVNREDTEVANSRSGFTDRLTPKQRAALETAFHAGYFEWPRTTTGEEIADRLGITQATFSQHFRAAERAVFEAIFETDATDDRSASSPWGSAESDAESD